MTRITVRPLPAVLFFLVSSFLAAQQNGRMVSPTDVNGMEQALRVNSADLETRVRLLTLYSTPLQGKEAEFRQARLRHILWLVTNAAPSKFAGSWLAHIDVSGTPLADAEGFQQVAAEWMRQVSHFPEDPGIIENAATFMQFGNRDGAERLMKQAQEMEPERKEWPAQFGRFYAYAVLGVTSVAPDGTPVAISIADAQGAFAAHARSELDNTSDAAMVGTAGRVVSTAVPALVRFGARDEFFRPLAEAWLKKAHELDPKNGEWKSGYQQFNETPTRIRVSPEMQRTKLRTAPAAVYPDIARRAQIQGFVSFNAVITRDGHVADLQVTGGHPVLVTPAMEAVKSYIYEPTVVNGTPVEVLTRIDVPFKLE